MVRRGSTVRVRQRACEKACKRRPFHSRRETRSWRFGRLSTSGAHPESAIEELADEFGPRLLVSSSVDVALPPGLGIMACDGGSLVWRHRRLGAVIHPGDGPRAEHEPDVLDLTGRSTNRRPDVL